MKLPNRLKCIADMITDAVCLADIGTDHAFLPIYLLSENKIKYAIAADINKGPLEKAEFNIIKFNMEDKIKLCLSDGFSQIGEGEADTAVIAGMGGELIVEIMKKAPQSIATFVVQPMSHIYEMRKFLQDMGFKIVEEKLVAEGEKLYTVLKIKRGKQNWNETDLRISPLLKDSPLFRELLERNLRRIKRGIESLKNSSDTETLNKFVKLESEYETALKI